MNYTIVAGTSRKNSVTGQMAQIYQRELELQGVSASIIDLADMPENILSTTLYKKVKAENKAWEDIQEVVSNTTKFIFIIPEYNGSFPGILKVWVDALQFPVSFKGKKACLLGIADGTQGAAMAMSHFSDVLNYIGVHTLALRPRFIKIGSYMQEGELTNAEYIDFIRLQASQFIKF
ncbi:MAG: NADPH-dependent FMN reductase [Bacteroidia bacterium]